MKKLQSTSRDITECQRKNFLLKTTEASETWILLGMYIYQGLMQPQGSVILLKCLAEGNKRA